MLLTVLKTLMILDSMKSPPAMRCIVSNYMLFIQCTVSLCDSVCMIVRAHVSIYLCRPTCRAVLARHSRIAIMSASIKDVRSRELTTIIWQLSLQSAIVTTVYTKEMHKLVSSTILCHCYATIARQCDKNK